MNDLPIIYEPGVFSGVSFEEIDNGIIWEQREAPRSEAYYALHNVPYTYGRGVGERTYHPHTPFSTFSKILQGIWLTQFGLEPLELLFCNRYADQHQHLGWHADDSPSVDPARPIVVITFGAERKIKFKKRTLTPTSDDEVFDLVLGHGSVLTMKPGMQQTHLHRIPKHDRPCGPRISLTFRGLTPGLTAFTDHH
jgi:alkylated DNA repair dioxygenase AlkB